jgi:hypothetical protein
MVAGVAAGPDTGAEHGSRFVGRAAATGAERRAMPLSQVLEGLARDPKVRRFKSFRKTVVHMG